MIEDVLRKYSAEGFQVDQRSENVYDVVLELEVEGKIQTIQSAQIVSYPDRVHITDHGANDGIEFKDYSSFLYWFEA